MALDSLSTSIDMGAQREFLCFKLGNQEYGIDVLKVQEIRGCDGTTPLANTPPFITGVIDLRGTIVPMVDLRIKFELAQAEYDQFTVAIVLNISGRTVGIIVDGVSDVVILSPEQIKPLPHFSSAVDTAFITGLGSLEDRMLILLDIEQLMLSDGMALFDTARQAFIQE